MKRQSAAPVFFANAEVTSEASAGRLRLTFWCKSPGGEVAPNFAVEMTPHAALSALQAIQSEVSGFLGPEENRDVSPISTKV